MIVSAKPSNRGTQSLAVNKASPGDKGMHSRFRSDFVWARKNGLIVNGLPYSDDIVGRGGIHLKIYCNPEHMEDKDALRDAIGKIVAKRDVVKHSIIVIPTDWEELTLEYPKAK